MKALIVLMAFLSLCTPFSALYSSPEKKKVLVIESYHKEMYWDAAYRRGIKNVIGDKATLYFFEMDTKRLPKSEHAQRATLAIEEIDRINPDLVMLGDDNALKLVGPDVLKRELPLVFLGINGNPRNYFRGHIPKGMAGVLERPPLKRSLEFIRKTQPDWKKVLVLFDSSNTSKIYENSPFFFQGRHNTTYLNFKVEVHLTNSLDELKEKVISAQSTHDALFLGGLNTVVDNSGNHVHLNEITKWIYQHSKIPLFGFWRGSVGFNKSIGGYVADGQYMGEQAARLVDRILNGEAPKRILIEQIKDARLVLSQSSLDHWKIQIPLELTSEAEFID